jgi:paraquat-inducible protein A
MLRMDLSSLIACHECDLLQKKVALPPHGVGRCRRCSAVLYRDSPHGLDKSLACTLGALILFAIANAYPIVGLEVQGNRVIASLYDTLHTLWNDGREDVALLVGATTMVTPALQIGLMLYLLFPLRFNRLAAGAIPLLRFLQTVKAWSMTEVFMLGILVSLVKLEHIAHVEVGTALWAFGALIPLLIVAVSAFNPDEIWARVRRAA